MRTLSSSNLPGESSPNPTSSNPKRRNRRRSKQPFIFEKSPADTMADQRTMAELLRTPIEGYAEAIVVPPILAEQFELKYNLINMMTLDQFFRLEKHNPHDHILWFNKITSTIKYKDVPNSTIKLMLFPFSLAGAARRWLKKEPPRSILTWEDLVSKFIYEFFPPSRTTNLQNEISNFQQRFDESFHEAWDRYKDLLRACPHHGFTELHKLDTFYNALNPADQYFLNYATGGNLLERCTQDVLMIIKNKSKVRNSRNKSIVSQVKSSDGNSSSSSSEIAKLTHALNQQTSVVTIAMTAILKQFQATPPPAFVKAVEEICVTCGGDHPYYQCLIADGNTFPEFQDNIQGYVSAAVVNYNQGSGPLPSKTIANPEVELKAITTRSGLVLDGPSVPMPPPFINLKEDERVEETLTDPELGEFTIKVPPPLVQKPKPPSQRNYVVNQRDPLHPNIPYPLRMHKQKTLLSNKEKLLELENTPLNENCSAVILKKLLEKLEDPGKFLIPCGFSELKCKALADLGASMSLMPLYVWKKLGLPELISTRMTLELANRVICTPSGIKRDVFVPVGKFTFPANFVSVNYESDPLVSLILGRPFLRTARALIGVHREEMILYDIFDPEGDIVLIKKLLNLASTKELPPHNINPLNGITTSSSSSSSIDYLLEEFTDKLALITFPPGNDDLSFDIESDLKEIEYLLNHDLIKEMDSILEDSINESNPADSNDNLVDTIPEMFIDEHTLDYLSPPLYDEYDDDLDELESDNDDAYNDPFDSKGEKIKESKLLIDELDPPRSITVQVTPDKNVKKIAISNASLILEDFNPPLYELPFYKEVFGSETLLSFLSENEEKVFKPRILTSKGVHSSLLLELSHRGPKTLKVIKIFECPMEIFPCSYGEDIRILDVSCLYFYPP
uniref:Reverse transcriptase domain-containing protein n=1 Tax=Tanacetum cinerariifolium TaxID=118510 RepID=A0A6L2LPB2_TANCI|nr:reverse transcriptase domain-containing protein [Tanacetum cinerariifolium]